MTQGEKLLKRLQSIQKAENRPVLVSVRVLVGDDGIMGWFVDNHAKAEGIMDSKENYDIMNETTEP